MMTELVREDRDAEFTPGVSDGALEVGLMHPVADFTVGPRMEAGVVRREEPGPRPSELVIRVF